MSDALHVINVEAAIYRDDQWLMIERSAEEEHAGGTLSMVGGTVELDDADDNILEAAIDREVMEEVAVRVGANKTYVESKAFVGPKGNHVVDIVLLCPYESGEPRAVDASEVAWVGWMSLSQILEHAQTPPWIRQSMIKAEDIRAAQEA